jgi:hypothetical protein
VQNPEACFGLGDRVFSQDDTSLLSPALCSTDILESMSPAAKKKTRKKKKSVNWLAWLPLVLGIIVTPFTVRAAGIFALTGPAALRTLYPYALLPAEHVFGLRDAVAEAASQAMMYLQFPAYGAAMMLVMRKWRVGIAIAVAVGLHLAGVGSLWLLNTLAR